MFDRKALRPWVRGFAIFLAVSIWTFSATYTSLSALWKSNEEVMKAYATLSEAQTGSATKPGVFSTSGPVETAATSNAKQQSSWMPEWLKLLTHHSWRWGWLGVPIVALLEILRKWLIRNVRDKQTEKAIKKVVDYFYDATRPSDGKPINYRVTLFKYRKFSYLQAIRWLLRREKRRPWHGWLAPYERSGSFRNRTGTRWAASFDQISENKGVAGRIFCECSSIRIENLSDAEEMSKSSRKLRAYAKATNCTIPWVSRVVNASENLPRSFWGTPVETSSGNAPWGVILIDSNLPQLVDPEVIEREARIVLKMLSILITSTKEP